MRIDIKKNSATVFLDGPEYDEVINFLKLGEELEPERAAWLSRRFTPCQFDRSDDDFGLFARFMLPPEVTRIWFVDDRHFSEFSAWCRRQLENLN